MPYTFDVNQSPQGVPQNLTWTSSNQDPTRICKGDIVTLCADPGPNGETVGWNNSATCNGGDNGPGNCISVSTFTK